MLQRHRARPARYAHTLLWGLVVVAVAFSGCSLPRSADVGTFDPADTAARPIELTVTDHADFEALAAQELTFVGPETDATGEKYITMFTTSTHAASLQAFGFTPRGYTQRTALDSDFIAFGPSCAMPAKCATVTSDYFKSYDDIVAELQDMDAQLEYVTLTTIGTSFEGREIVGIQFGPLEVATDPPPTLYIMATYHAREWLTTAVALQLARWLHELVTQYTIDGVSDFPLASALAYNAIVIVPVVNPDGYEYTREGTQLINGVSKRDWRSNRNQDDCAYGVDLNRNHSTAWSTAIDQTVACTSLMTYRGPGAASEQETQAIENLMTGTAFPDPQVPIGLISYHSYADFLIYSDGYGTVSGSPSCGLQYTSNCFNPDFTILRDLFGDTHSDLFVDRVSYLPTTFDVPFFRDHSRTILYGVSGDVGLHATYGPNRMLAVTPELPSTCLNFYAECDPQAEDTVRGVALDQLDVIRRILPRAAGLASSDPSSAYATNAVGTISSGMMTREYYPAGPDSETARATFVKSVFKEASTGSLTAIIKDQDGNDQTYNYQLARRGAQYELFTLPLAQEGLDPLCLPDEIVSTNGEAGGIDTANEGGCIDLCDAGRLDASGWEIREGSRGSSPAPDDKDCWWTPVSDNGELIYPGKTEWDPGISHCHFTFSAKWGFLTSDKIWLEREAADGGWEMLMTFASGYPYNGGPPSTRLVSYSFEADTFIEEDRTPAFRLRVQGTVPALDQVQIFDPVIYCRVGALP